jgi:hypothetical protein
MTAKKDRNAATDLSPLAGATDSRAAPARYMPNARECALLLLMLIQKKEREIEKDLSRFRVAELSLRRIWGRHRITPEFVDDVNEWLLRAGRTLFSAGNSYGVIMTSAVESWSRLTSKRIDQEVKKVLAGDYDFTELEQLLIIKDEGIEEDR